MENHSAITNLLDRGVENVYPSRDFLETRLKEGKPLTLYLGIDPTGPDLHLGHAIVLRKMREFQDLGHKLILLIGDFTGMIGDPTDKGATRKRLTRKEVLQNAKKYKTQASKIIRFKGPNKADIRYNSRWLAKMTFNDLVELSANFTVQRMMERDMFENRAKEGKPIYLHEFLYPIMQAYDCVAMNVDGEIGGNDQTFNMLAGRDLMKTMRSKEKFVVTTKLLVDPTGKKMGKSEGNMITLADSAEEMYGKVMSWPDELIIPGMELLTDLSLEEVKSISDTLKNGGNPRDAKQRLASEVVTFYHSQEAADEALENFTKQFAKGEVPDEMPETVISGSIAIVDLLVENGLCSSNSDARRTIDGGGVKVNGHAIEGYDVEITPTLDVDVIVQKGKRHFLRVKKG